MHFRKCQKLDCQDCSYERLENNDDIDKILELLDSKLTIPRPALVKQPCEGKHSLSFIIRYIRLRVDELE